MYVTLYKMDDMNLIIALWFVGIVFMFMPWILLFIKKPWSYYLISTFPLVWIAIFIEAFWLDFLNRGVFIPISMFCILPIFSNTIIWLVARFHRDKYLREGSNQSHNSGLRIYKISVVTLFTISIVYFVFYQLIPSFSYKHCQREIYKECDGPYGSKLCNYDSKVKIYETDSVTEVDFQKCMLSRGYKNWRNLPGYHTQ